MVYINMVFSLKQRSLNLKIVQFWTASEKTLITSAGLRLKQRFFLNISLNHKLYEYGAIFNFINELIMK